MFATFNGLSLNINHIVSIHAVPSTTDQGRAGQPAHVRIVMLVGPTITVYDTFENVTNLVLNSL